MLSIVEDIRFGYNNHGWLFYIFYNPHKTVGCTRLENIKYDYFSIQNNDDGNNSGCSLAAKSPGTNMDTYMFRQHQHFYGKYIVACQLKEFKDINRAKTKKEEVAAA